MKSKVYFSRSISAETVLKLYQLLDSPLTGKVAIKVHSGEPGNQNFLRPPFWKPIIEHVGGTVTECNTAYDGGRNTTAKHLYTLRQHGWNASFDVDLLDAEGPDLELAIPNGKRIQKNYVGKNITNYDSMLVLSHFKGHPMGGYGGALKQLSIGVASAYGKAYIHGVGKPEEFWTSDRNSFLESMADAAGSVMEFFGNKIAYINGQHVRGLRLLRQGRGPLHEGHRCSGLSGPGGHRSGLSGHGVCRYGRSRSGASAGAYRKPQRCPHHRSRRCAGSGQPGV